MRVCLAEQGRDEAEEEVWDGEGGNAFFLGWYRKEGDYFYFYFYFHYHCYFLEKLGMESFVFLFLYAWCLWSNHGSCSLCALDTSTSPTFNNQRVKKEKE